MIEDADRIIVTVTGIVDWRPVFVLGLQAMFVIVFTVGVVIGAVLWMRR